MNTKISIIPFSKQNKAVRLLVSLKDLLRVIALCFFNPWQPSPTRRRKKGKRKKPTNL